MKLSASQKQRIIQVLEHHREELLKLIADVRLQPLFSGSASGTWAMDSQGNIKELGCK
jgi:hypothetical protein